MSAALLNTVLRAGRSLPLNGGERLVLVVAAWRADESGRTFMPGLAVLEQAGLSTQAGYPALRRLANFGLLRETRPVTIDVSRLHQMACADLLGEGETSKEVASRQLANASKELANSSKEVASKEVATISKEVASKEVASKQLASKKVANFLASNLPQDGKELATYKLETIKTRSVACAREGVPEDCSGASGAPKGDGQTEVRAVSPVTGRAEPVTVRDKASLGAFMREYPKRSMNRLLVVSAWAAVEAEGISGARILGAMREAALTKGWQEEGGRFVPRAENWLRDRGFEQFLEAADRRASAPTQAQREAAEAARARERMAVDEEVLAMMEDENGDHV